MIDPNQGVKGMDVLRHKWSILNLLYINQSRCGDMMYKWKLQISPECDCAAVNQIINHIITESQARIFGQDIEEIHEIISKAIVWTKHLDVCF